MAKTRLTSPGIVAAIKRSTAEKRDIWLSDDASTRGDGRLQLRVRITGRHRWYWRYTKPGGGTVRILVGTYTADRSNNGLTLAEARAEVADHVALYKKPESRDVRAYYAREAKREADEQAQADHERRAALAAQTEAGQHTLSKLFDAYVAHLRRQGKATTARDAQNIFKNHITAGHPELASKPARDVEAIEIAVALRALTDAEKGRTAAKLRSYLRAAYAVAAGAALDSNAPAAFLPFKVGANPVQAIPALATYNRVRERVLSEAELRAYWAAIDAAPDSPARNALLLGLLLGGQRPTQLVRAKIADVDRDAKMLTLRDSKGKRTQPRIHVLPLCNAAVHIVERCIERAEKHESSWLFSSNGKKALRAETVTNAAAEIATALLAKPKVERVVRESFQLRDIRRTCETSFARMGISRDIRAQIQSHGLGGIQARHYDKHDYMTEKRAALEAWARFLFSERVDNVSDLAERRTQRGG